MAEVPSWMFTKALSHRQKVCRLYKRASRELENWYLPDFFETKLQRRVLRARFEANRDEKDARKASILLADGCRQLWQNRHHRPHAYAYDAYGVAYDRGLEILENQEDQEYTYPEREQFPYYFNRREQSKKELLEHWHKIEESWNEEIEKIQKELPKEKSVLK